MQDIFDVIDALSELILDLGVGSDDLLDGCSFDGVNRRLLSFGRGCETLFRHDVGCWEGRDVVLEAAEGWTRWTREKEEDKAVASCEEEQESVIHVSKRVDRGRPDAVERDLTYD